MPHTFRGLNLLAKSSELVRIPQRLFNPNLVKAECRKEFCKALKKNVYIWKDMMFRNGFLYQEFRINKLVIEDVCPMLDEIRRFQVDMNLLEDNAAFESDLDEWDLMKDNTVLKTIWNEKRTKIQVGDRCKVTEGHFHGCQGTIKSFETEQQIACLLTEDKVPVLIKVKTEELQKFFEIGESVRVLQGIHAGEPGVVTEICLPDRKHALILMEHTRAELKVPMTNLRKREELDPNSKFTLSQFLIENSKNAIKTGMRQVSEVYNAGDMVLFDNFSSVGLVLQVHTDSLKVLTDANQTQLIKLGQVSKKFEIETRGVSGRRLTKRAAVVTDKFHNSITMGTIVKPLEKGPFFGCLGEIRGIFKTQLFIRFRTCPNIHLLRDSHGYLAIKTHQVINAAFDEIDQGHRNKAGHSEQRGFILNKLDRKIQDRKAIGQTVFISKGNLKGYKGKVVYADETTAILEVFAKNNQTVTVPRDHMSFITDTTAPLRMQSDAPIQISFDEAMNQEFVN